MTRRRTWIIAAVVLLLVALMAGRLAMTRKAREATPAAVKAEAVL